jgi:hypothetical protein
VKRLRRAIAAATLVGFFLGAPATAHAQFGIPGLPGFPNPLDTIGAIKLLKDIYDELARKKKHDDGISFNLEMILKTLLRAFPEGEKLLNEVDDVMAVVNDVRREMRRLSCGWQFSGSDPTAPFRRLLDKRMWLCKGEVRAMYGNDTFGEGRLPGSDLNEFYDYLTALTENRLSGRTQSTYSSWFRVFKETHDTSAKNRTAPGQAERDTAVMMAMLQAVQVDNANTVTTDFLVRQLEDAEEMREERLGKQLATWMYAAGVPR